MTREEIRGKRLDSDCRTARTSTHESGFEDNRVFCYGLVDRMTDEYYPKCKICKAHVNNAEPLKVGGQE